MKASHLHLALLVSGIGVFVWSGIGPYDRVTWVEEVLPAAVGGALLVGFYKRFQFTGLAYVMAWAYALIMMVGGHWTYANVPIGNWLRDAMHLSRNHFDRLGHFFQGAAPAIFARELLLRTSPVRRGKWLFFIVLCICLAISACYELIEWWASLVSNAEDFVGSQGDKWDAQADMLMCAIGAICSLLFLGGWHSRQLAKLPNKS